MRRAAPDLLLLLVVIILLAMGVGAVYSSSVAVAEEKFGSPVFFLERHLLRLGLALVLAGIAAVLDYNFWFRLGRRPAIGLAVLLVAATALLPGSEVGHSRRFLVLGAFSSEPLEFLRFISVVYLASVFASRGIAVRRFTSGALEPLVWWALGAGALLLQSSVGMAAVFSIVWFAMLFLGEARLRHIAGAVAAGLAVLLLYCSLSPYHRERMDAFVLNRGDQQGIRYHPHQSKVALGTGGVLGVGWGRGVRKMWYLPHPHTDFVFSSIGEEGGFVASAMLLALYGVFAWRGFRAAARAPDSFGYYLGSGMVLLVVALAALHVAVCVGLAPVSGLPLPFVSFGGSSLLVNAVAAGVLLSISRSYEPVRQAV